MSCDHAGQEAILDSCSDQLCGIPYITIFASSQLMFIAQEIAEIELSLHLGCLRR